MAKFFCNMSYLTQINDEQNSSKASDRRGGVWNRRHAEEIIMSGIVKSSTGTRTGAILDCKRESEVRKIP
jgi:hypothetical protein